MMSSRLEPMSTALMIDHRSDVWAACKCVGALLRCVLFRLTALQPRAPAAQVDAHRAAWWLRLASGLLEFMMSTDG